MPARTDTGIHVNNSVSNLQSDKMSSSAPYATAQSHTDSDLHTGGRRKFDGTNQRHDAPFATNYPDVNDDNTPKKNAGRRRYESQDAAREAPFATNNGQEMFQAPPPSEPAAVNIQSQCGARQIPIKPSDNSDVFRYDGSAADTPQSGGRRRFPQQQHEAPFATNCGPDERFRNVPGRTNTNNAAGYASAGYGVAAGERRREKNVPPPNSSGAGVENRSQLTDCPFARN